MKVKFCTRDENENYYQAQMTKNQFLALNEKITLDKIINELSDINYWKKINKAKNFDYNKTKQCLLNSWSTECLLVYNNTFKNRDFAPYTLHWAFPQAYYSVFMSILAFYSSVGYSQTSHVNVSKQLGVLIFQNKFPASISFYAKGGLNNILCVNLVPNDSEPSIKLELSDPCSVDKQISQLLKSTREIQLKDQKDSMKNVIKTQKGKSKQNFSTEDWLKVSDSVGYTTLYHFLYRKRLKSNYRDIQVFFHPDIDSANILQILTNLVHVLNLISEFYIFKSVGKKIYESLINEFSNSDIGVFRDRYKLFSTIK